MIIDTSLFNTKFSEQIELINSYANDKFFDALKERGKEIDFPSSDHKLFKLLSELVYYSQNAKSDIVANIIQQGIMDKIFCNYNIEYCSQLNPCDVVEQHWTDFSGIRQKTKVFQILMIARLLKRNDILSDLKNSGIPKKITSENDITNFWIKLMELKKYFENLSFPFLSSTTTILHLLMEIGYHTIKPDSAVQKAFNQLLPGTIERIGTINDQMIKEILSSIQRYSIANKLKPKQLDLYLLTIGKQRYIVENNYVDNNYFNL